MFSTVLVFVTGCGGGDDPAAGRAVVAAFYPLAFAAEQVNPGADVANLTPAGAEPHDLELTARDVERVRDAEVVLFLRGFMPALDDAIRDRANAVDLLEGLDLLQGGDEHADAGEQESREEAAVDPHVWLDPMRFAAVAERVAEELGETADASAFVAELEELDRDFRAGLSSCERRTLVTSHAAFGYLADAYGLEQIALTGISPQAEPSARALEELVAEVEEEGATTVFFETLVSPDLANTVAREAGARTAVLNPLEGLTDEERAAGADYFSVMRENLAALRSALACP